VVFLSYIFDTYKQTRLLYWFSTYEDVFYIIMDSIFWSVGQNTNYMWKDFHICLHHPTITYSHYNCCTNKGFICISEIASGPQIKATKHFQFKCIIYNKSFIWPFEILINITPYSLRRHRTFSVHNGYALTQSSSLSIFFTIEFINYFKQLIKSLWRFLTSHNIDFQKMV